MLETGGMWVRESAWAGLLSDARSGRPDGVAGLTVEPLEGLALASITAAPESGSTLPDRLEPAFRARPPDRPRVEKGPEAAFVWSGPDHWLAISKRPDLQARLEEAAGDHGTIVDQTDSRAVLRLTGPRVRDVLAKGCPIDLHPLAFRLGDAAVTLISHVGVQLWRPDDEGFVLAVSRSYTGSFWSWLSASAGEFGCEVRG